jgi:hypothetical protein
MVRERHSTPAALVLAAVFFTAVAPASATPLTPPVVKLGRYRGELRTSVRAGPLSQTHTGKVTVELFRSRGGAGGHLQATITHHDLRGPGQDHVATETGEISHEQGGRLTIQLGGPELVSELNGALQATGRTEEVTQASGQSTYDLSGGTLQVQNRITGDVKTGPRFFRLSVGFGSESSATLQPAP